jgi:hypothetical protein
MHHGGAK